MHATGIATLHKSAAQTGTEGFLGSFEIFDTAGASLVGARLTNKAQATKNIIPTK